MVILVNMKLMALAAVSLMFLTVVGCGSSQEPSTQPVVPGVVVLSDAGSTDSGKFGPDDGPCGLIEAGVYADSGHDAANPADPVKSCFDCPAGQTLECASYCSQIGGFIAGDGEPYQCCHW